MHATRRSAIAGSSGVLLILGLAWTVQAQKPAAASIVGVWRVSEVTLSGENPRTIANPEPGLQIFTRTHYSFTAVAYDRKRVDLPTDREPTEKEYAEAFGPFIAQAGTYELNGTAVTFRRIVAKVPNNMRPGRYRATPSGSKATLCG